MPATSCRSTKANLLDHRRDSRRHSYTLRLNGTFKLEADDGRVITISGTHMRALIATLAVAKDMKRSRKWLQSMLWSRVGPDHAANSLRQSMFQLRKLLGQDARLLGADQYYVWLCDVCLLEHKDGSQSEASRCPSFFEDAPMRLGEPFDDWLRLERAHRHNQRMPCSAAMQARAMPGRPTAMAHAGGVQHPGLHAGQSSQDTRPVIVMAPPRTQAQDLHSGALATMVCNQVVEAIRVDGFLRVFDSRDLFNDQLGQFDQASCVHASAVIAIQLVQYGEMLSIWAHATHPTSRLLMWSASFTARHGRASDISNDQLVEFGNQIADCVALAVFDSTKGRRDLTAPHEPQPMLLFAAVHQLMAHTAQAIQTGRKHLIAMCENEPSGIVLAWLAFSLLVRHGESQQTLEKHDIAEVRALCRRALELDPSNPTVLALVGHAQGFVLQDPALGGELLETARRIAPYSALSWDFSAMNALYRDDAEEGYQLAQKASRLARFSPYRPILESSLAICAAASGRHEKALFRSHSVLAHCQNYMPVMRHMFGSLCATGAHDEAREMFERIIATDAQFSGQNVQDPHYPLPSPASRRLIASAFSHFHA